MNLSPEAAARHLEALVAALAPFATRPISEEGMCHSGIVTIEECVRCSEILAARQALDAYHAEVARGE